MNPSSKRQQFIWAAIFCLLGGGLLYRYATADPPGYCRAQQRYIADEEFTQTSLALLRWKQSQRKTYWGDPKLFEGYLKALDLMERNRNYGSFVQIARGDTP